MPRFLGFFQSLFQPIQIGPVGLRNRIVLPPMSTNFGDPRNPGFVSERHKSYYVERAKGGAGLIMIERVNIYPSGSMRSFGLDLSDDKFIAGCKELAASIQEQGARCAVQLGHAGRIGGMSVDARGNTGGSGPGTERYFAASPLPHPVTGVIAQEFKPEQLDELTECFADAAERAKRAGFDGVELHGAHGYFLGEFLSPYSNKRTDQYGGDIEGRARFPLQVVSRVKERLGDDTVLSYRMSVVEFVEGGLDIEDAVYFAKRLEEAGVHIIHVTAGINETLSTMNRAIPPMSFPRGRVVPYAEQIKKEVKIPVMVVQRINTPELADEIIRQEKADLVATGRALIADPHWPLKAQEGRVDEIRRCIACNQGCMEGIILGKTLSCLHNPEVGYENLYALKKKAEIKRKILVVGGGVAGMEAAWVLETRGHDVTLIEKENRLGGVARTASVINEKKEFGGVLEFLSSRLEKAGINVRLGEEVTAQHIEGGRFDEIIVATGSVPILPHVTPGAACKVRLAKDVLEDPEGVGEKVVVLGGGSVGLEVAEYLHHLGRNVTVVEMEDKIARDLGPLNRVNVLERIEKSSMKVLLNTRVIELSEAGLRVSRGGKEETLGQADTFVVALGAKPNKVRLPSREGHMHYIGDCSHVGNAMDAIHEAFMLAVSL